MSGHTPGPWEVRLYSGEVDVAAPCGRMLYFAATESDECTIADARLIAAAPALLSALQDARQFIANGIELGYIRMPDASTPDSGHKTPALIDAAIAKATQP